MKGLLSPIILFGILIPIVVIATAASAAPKAVAINYPAERAALMSLYNSTSGEGWNENTGWGSDSSYCEWFGVTCDPAGHVKYLDLAANQLTWLIPVDIENLAALQRLDLSGNLIADPLPEELGNLAQLQILDLSGNEYCIKGCGRSLRGGIPASLGRLANLRTLDLSDNVLEGAIPAELGDLALLQTLDLSGNHFCTPEYFTGEIICQGGLHGVIPAALSSLSALQELQLQGNKDLCWETVPARSWALTLPFYSGPTDCSYLPLLPHLYFKKSAGSSSLAFIKSADPREGTDFTFDLSGPANPTKPTLLTKWGSQGSANGEFWYPRDVALDAAGNVYVADTANNRIQKFDKDGAFITKWGSHGNAGGQFNVPHGLTVDNAGNIYVVDEHNHRIQKFDKDGAFISKWGREGNAEGEFWYPQGVALDAAGNVYVADTANNRIQKFDKDGAFITKWGSYGSGDGQFVYPADVATGLEDTVYVIDSENFRIQKFDKDGNFITMWGSQGSGAGQFSNPVAVAADTAGNVYVTEQKEVWGYDRIQKFDKDGNFLTKWGSEGSADGQFKHPTGVALDAAGNVYVADSSNHRIQKFLATRFVLDDADPDDGDPIGSSVIYDKLPLGRYQVTERAASGWDLKNLTCKGAENSKVTADLDHRMLTIDLAADEHVTCTFTNHLQ